MWRKNKLSRFVFKIHANLDPNTRTGFFSGYAPAALNGTNTSIMYGWIKMSALVIHIPSWQGQKSIIEDAYAGDVVGLLTLVIFKIGDTLTEGEDFYFTGIPSRLKYSRKW